MKLNNNDDSHNSGLNLLIYNMLLDIESHPAWVCGLKLTSMSVFLFLLVTPCVGVWIETQRRKGRKLHNRSHPAWVCGLKLMVQTEAFSALSSHPAWVCGLKHPSSCIVRDGNVTPCVGVWIETTSYA